MGVDEAIARCPFLHNLSGNSGTEHAARLATNPLKAVEGGLDSCDGDRGSLEATFALFHGSGGVMPLPRHAGIAPSGTDAATGQVSRGTLSSSTGTGPRLSSRLASAPMASLSMGMPNFFGDFFHNLARQQQQQQQQPKPRTVRPPQPSHSASSSTTSGQCPLRKMLGPVAGWVFNKAGNLQCPTFIVQARAVLAATPPVKTLRPQALPIKMLAVAAIAAAANIPCGMWREHTEKFSLQWVMAVHASIPFVAMLRKAVIMPKMAIILTIAAAVAGQAMGARLERERLRKSKLPAAASASSPAQAGINSSLTVRRSKAAPSKLRTLARKAPAAVSLSSKADSTAAVTSWLLDDLDWALERPGKGLLKQQQLPLSPNVAHLM